MKLGSTSRKAPGLSKNVARPLLKWVGGKRQLLAPISEKLPEKINTYFEPFVGGGAVFFALRQEKRFKKAVLSDQNSELIETYRSVRDDVEGVVRELKKYRHSEEAYYEARAQNPRSPLKCAARMIYLNRTGYNGLYRVNRSGKFNVPFGRYVRPNYCDEEHLHAVALALKGVRLEIADFEELVASCRPGDAVYFDPPYVPVSPTAKFSEYHHKAFDDAEHERLEICYGKLWERGVATVLSNSDTPRTRELFDKYEHEFVSARRSINSVSKKRGPIEEILVFGGKRKRTRKKKAAR